MGGEEPAAAGCQDRNADEHGAKNGTPAVGQPERNPDEESSNCGKARMSPKREPGTSASVAYAAGSDGFRERPSDRQR